MSGIERIAAERQRQIDVEGYTPGHDEQHSPIDLMNAAAAYLHAANGRTAFARVQWPWDARSFKPGPVERDLEKAGALIAAALDAFGRGETS